MIIYSFQLLRFDLNLLNKLFIFGGWLMWPFVHDFWSTSVQSFKEFKNKNIDNFKIFVFNDIFSAFIIILD